MGECASSLLVYSHCQLVGAWHRSITALVSPILPGPVPFGIYQTSVSETGSISGGLWMANLGSIVGIGRTVLSLECAVHNGDEQTVI